MSCGICLSKLKEPVSVPCGHLYCTECLTGHVSATSPDGFTSTCPSCRETFNMVRPELTCLPKKFHQYIVPSIRRVYIDMSRHENLRKKLSASEARVAALEKDKERLMAECERQIAAARAHSHSETHAILRAKELKEMLRSSALDAARAEEARDDAQVAMEEAQEAMEEAKEAAAQAQTIAEESQAALRAMKIKYDKMKRHCRSLALDAARREEGREPDDEEEIVFEGPSGIRKKRTSALVDLSLDEAPVSPKRLRIIRPLPRSRQSLVTPVNAAPRPRSSFPGNIDAPQLPLGSPFHS
ncbi:Tripartite motif-containing protein 26 [Mycena venus]|uniref:Tripartite motif-containing protein 26 n=1 Tax=Mycena venus TaxID=2733690 RepID=A0A8H6YCF5_9AGAR|nr:Tripartite motif-containing protein 26 [Mycena venus]